jgi:hypothetical protein
MKQKFKDLKVNDRVKTLHSGMATVVAVGCNEGTMVKLDCDVKKWNCPYFYEHELDLKTNKIMKQSAVEWLEKQIICQQNIYINMAKKNKSLTKQVDAILTATTLLKMKCKKAKEMEEKQQGYSEEDMKEAFRVGFNLGCNAVESLTNEIAEEWFKNGLKKIKNK